MATPETWTIRSMLEWCEGYLGRHGDASPRRSAEVLVGKACKLERIGLYLDIDRPLSHDELDILRDDVRKRGEGMPLQYLTGTAPFRYLELKVRPGVLIPRPETEVLVSEALNLLPSAPKPQDSYDRVLVSALMRETGDEIETSAADDQPIEEHLVADICTGSGCIACSLATEHPHTRIVATDISDEALALAAENVADCGVSERVKLLKADLGSTIDPQLIGLFDLVVSNPPYVPSALLGSIPREVAEYEPTLALDGGEDGLDLFRRLTPWAFSALKNNGHFLCELHEDCLDEACKIALDCGFEAARVVRDLTGRERVLIADKA